jgi:hypothetical protein
MRGKAGFRCGIREEQELCVRGWGLPQAAQPAPGNGMVCCEEAMKPRLVHARDRQGQTVFVAV